MRVKSWSRNAGGLGGSLSLGERRASGSINSPQAVRQAHRRRFDKLTAGFDQRVPRPFVLRLAQDERRITPRRNGCWGGEDQLATAPEHLPCGGSA